MITTHLPKTAGIYAIVNTVNNHIYVGSSVGIKARLTRHRSQLTHGTHHSPYLQHSYNTHGGGAFTVVVLQLVEDKATLIEREQHWIDKLRPEYNIAKIAGNGYNLGRVLTPEHRAKISAGGKGIKKSDETRARMSASLMGNTKSKGLIRSTETREKMSVSGKLRWAKKRLDKQPS